MKMSFYDWCVQNNKQRVLDEWDKNLNLVMPNEVASHTHIKYWFTCNNGHSLLVRPTDRARAKYGCKLCYGNVVRVGENDLHTVNPILALEWDYNKNYPLTPSDVCANSSKSFWWICAEGHSYKATMSNRNNGTTCSVCSNRIVIQGINDLTTTHPQFAKQWDYVKNHGKTPEMFVAGSNYHAWWICDVCGHEWNTAIATRTITAKNGDCPECCKNIKRESYYRTIIDSRGSLENSGYEYLLDWDYESNIDIHTSDFTIGSAKKVWWKCRVCGHRWLSTICDRTFGHGCPECARINHISSLQNKICEYINEQYNFPIQHEYNCSLICRNPKTNMILPYDNELVINGMSLIIECNGKQHYEISSFAYLTAKAQNTTPEQALADQQHRDRIKKEYALSQGYAFLEIPYWTEHDESYKKLIDDKILTLPQQNNIPA